MPILRCTSSFTYWVDGQPISVAAGDLVDSKDPAVKGRDQWFETVEANVERRTTSTPVEQATAAPGEKRSTRKATAARKSAT